MVPSSEVAQTKKVPSFGNHARPASLPKLPSARSSTHGMWGALYCWELGRRDRCDEESQGVLPNELPQRGDVGFCVNGSEIHRRQSGKQVGQTDRKVKGREDKSLSRGWEQTCMLRRKESGWCYARMWRCAVVNELMNTCDSHSPDLTVFWYPPYY